MIQMSKCRGDSRYHGKQLMEEVLQQGPVMNTFHPIGTVMEKIAFRMVLGDKLICNRISIV